MPEFSGIIKTLKLTLSGEIMKYRGVKIIKIKYQFAIDIGKTEKAEVKAIYKIGYSFIGGTYPDTLEGCKESIDNLINDVMRTCDVSETDAIKLINENY